MDKIIIKGLRVFAHHGVNEEETLCGQHFVLDIEAQTNLTAAGLTDELNDTVSYAQMIKTVRRVMTEQNDKLLERAARRVADALLEEYDRLESVTTSCSNAPPAAWRTRCWRNTTAWNR